MKTLLSILSLFASILIMNAADSRCFELRTYHAAPGKIDDLHKRFRDHTLKLFEKHGMESLGYWVQLDKDGNKTDRLTFLLAYRNREAREKSWKAFTADPDWQAAKKASEANGPLVEKVENPYLAKTDYSPTIKDALGGTFKVSRSDSPRVFELRIYKTPPGRLEALHARFRDHTVKLFSKHGMQNVGYWTPMDQKDGAEDTLIYILAHKDREAAANSFKAFRADPDWVAARKASEEKAGGSLTTKVESIFMTPTDYSPMR
jgi:hypothetical protein